MPTSSTFIITGNPTGDINSTLAANGYDKGFIQSSDHNYVRVLNVNQDRTINYELLNDNLAGSKIGTDYTGSIAYPYSNAIFILPVPGEIVKIFNAPDGFGLANNSVQPTIRVYYEVSPLSAWQDVNNNIVLDKRSLDRLSKDKANLNTNLINYRNNANGF